MTMPDLLPCPFCPIPVSTEYFSHKGWSICCKNKKCQKACLDKIYQTEEEAIAAWNTRAQPPSADCVMVPRDNFQADCTILKDGTKVLLMTEKNTRRILQADAPQNNPADDRVKGVDIEKLREALTD